MQCPDCGNTDLLAKFKCCPECGCRLPRAQSLPRKVEHGDHGVETTQLQQSAVSTGDNGDLGLDSSPIQGKFNIDLDYSRIQYFFYKSLIPICMGFDLIRLSSLRSTYMLLPCESLSIFLE